MIFIELFYTFFLIGLFGFGGGYGMLSMIQGEVVNNHHWLTTQEFTDVIAISQMTPGPIGVNAATFAGCDRLWSRWYRSLADGAYDLSGTVGDKKIASIAVSGDASLCDFVLRDGKVYDALVVVENKSANAVALTLPRGFRYLTPAGRNPLHLPANSMNLLTITRVSDDTFLVTRQKLQDVE